MEIKIGDLMRLSTPDDADGKLVLVVDVSEMSNLGQVPICVLVGETEPHVYLPSELRRVEKTFISQ